MEPGSQERVTSPGGCSHPPGKGAWAVLLPAKQGRPAGQRGCPQKAALSAEWLCQGKADGVGLIIWSTREGVVGTGEPGPGEESYLPIIRHLQDSL